MNLALSKKRWFRALGLLAGGALLALAFAPLPAGWLVEAVAPAAAGLSVESATLRLRPFGTGPALTMRGWELAPANRRLARGKRAAISLAWPALLAGRAAGLVAIEDWALPWPPDSPPSGPKPESATGASTFWPEALASLASRLEADPRALQITLQNGLLLRADGGQTPIPGRIECAVGHQTNGGLVARLQADLGEGGHAVVDAVSDRNARSARIEWNLAGARLESWRTLLPEPLARLSPSGVLALRGTAELDLATTRFVSADLTADADALACGAWSLLPPVGLHAELQVQDQLTRLTSKRLEVISAGARVAFDQLEITCPQTRDTAQIRWAARTSVGPLATWPESWIAKLRAGPPALAALAGEIQHAQGANVGELALRREPEGWRLEQVSARDAHTLTLGALDCHADWSARQPAPSAPVEVTFSMPSVILAHGAAPGTASPLAALDFPLEAHGSFLLSPSGRMRDAKASLRAGPGQLRPAPPRLPLERAIPFHELELEASSPDGRVFTARRASFVAGDTHLALSGCRLARQTDGRWRASLRAEGSLPRVADWAAWLPPAWLTEPARLGWTPNDWGIESFSFEASGDLAATQPAEATFATTGEARIRIGASTAPLHWTAQREQAGGPIAFTTRLSQLLPNTWPGGPAAGFVWSDLRVPLVLEASGRLAPPTHAPHARVVLSAGPGAVVLHSPGAQPSEFKIRSGQVEALVEGDPALIRCPLARLELEPGLSLELKNARLESGRTLRAAGDWTIAPLDLAAATASWPETLAPASRRLMQTRLTGGRLAQAGGLFAAAWSPETGCVVDRLEADAVLEHLRFADLPLPGAPGEAERLRLRVRWPGVEALVSGVQAPGLALPELSLSTLDARATPLVAIARAHGQARLEVLPAQWSSPGLAGTVSGSLTLEARLPLADPAQTQARWSGQARADALAWPGVLAGSASLDFAGARETRRVEFAGTADLSKLSWAAAKDLVAPAQTRLGCEADLDDNARPLRARFTLGAPALLGLPLDLQAAAEWSSGYPWPQRARLAKLAWGNTRLAGEWTRSPDRQHVRFDADQIDVPELWKTLGARFDPLAPAARTEPSPAPGSTEPAPPANWSCAWSASRVLLGGDRQLREVSGSWSSGAHGWPEQAEWVACEGENNRLAASFRRTPLDAPAGDFELTCANVPRWAGALAAPFASGPPPPPRLAPALREMTWLTGLLSNGAVALRGRIQQPRPDAPPAIETTVVVTDATLARVPFLIRLLALKTGRTLQERPLVRRLDIGRLGWSDQRLSVREARLDGTGLLDRLAIGAGTYASDTGSLAVEGSYFGLGFEISGTRSDPEIYLKDNNVLLRAVGQPSDLDFGTE